jgi:nucleoside-diphosphate-sugar epimerase
MNTQTQSELHVIFGTGPLGKWTARELVKMGRRVRMINRSGNARDLPAEVELIQSDAYDAQKNIELTRGATTIYQCAQAAYHEWAEKFPPLQQAILDAAIANGAKFVVAENIYMYGDTRGALMTEETPNNAHTQKGKVRQALTEAIVAAQAAGQVRAAVVRGSDFFGPDDPIYAKLFFAPALQGQQVQMIGRLDVPHTFTYAPDFGKALAIAGTRAEAMGHIWHVPSDKALTQQQLVNLMSEQVNKPVKVLAASKLMVKALGLFVPALREIVEMFYEFTQPFIMDSSKFTRVFGLQPTSMPEAVRQTIDWNRAQQAMPSAPKPELAAA